VTNSAEEESIDQEQSRAETWDKDRGSRIHRAIRSKEVKNERAIKKESKKRRRRRRRGDEERRDIARMERS
jgi:hypothetical protein